MGNANRIPHGGPITAKRIDLIENETRTTTLPPSSSSSSSSSTKGKLSSVADDSLHSSVSSSTPSALTKKQLHPSIRIRATAVSMQGWRNDMEDAHEILPRVTLPSIGPAAFFFLADGHGGSRVAQYAARQIVPRLLFANFENRVRCGAELQKYQELLLTSSSPTELAMNIENYQQQKEKRDRTDTRPSASTTRTNEEDEKGIRSNLWSPLYLPQDYDASLIDSELHEPLRQAFRDLDHQLFTLTHPSTSSSATKPSAFQSDYTGCTAIAAVISSSFIHIANAGDSRAVLFRNPDAPDTEKYSRLIYHAFGNGSSSSSSSSSTASSSSSSISPNPAIKEPSSSSSSSSSTSTTNPGDLSSLRRTNFSTSTTTTTTDSNHLSPTEWLLTPVPMSIDHKPYLPQEYARIIAAGSIVTVGGNGSGPPRVNGELAVSRALGDFTYKYRGDIRSTLDEHTHHSNHHSAHHHPSSSSSAKSTGSALLPPYAQAVCPIPDVSAIKRSIHDRFLILACDGLWDVMSNNDVAKFLSEREFRLMNRAAIAKALQIPFDHQQEKLNHLSVSPHGPSTFPPGGNAPGFHGKATSSSMVPSTFAYDSNVTTTAAAAGAAARMQRLYENPSTNLTTNGENTPSFPAVTESMVRNNPPSPLFRAQGIRKTNDGNVPSIALDGKADDGSTVEIRNGDGNKNSNAPLTMNEAAMIAMNAQKQQNDILSVLKGMGGSLGRSFSTSLNKNGSKRGTKESGTGSSQGKVNGLVRSNSTNLVSSTARDNHGSSTTSSSSSSKTNEGFTTTLTPLTFPPIDPTIDHDTSNMVTIQEIATIVADLADEALKRGSHDNITIILIAFPSAFSLPGENEGDTDSVTGGSGAMPLGVQLERKLYNSSKDSNNSSRNASNTDLHGLFANLNGNGKKSESKEGKENT